MLYGSLFQNENVEILQEGNLGSIGNYVFNLSPTPVFAGHKARIKINHGDKGPGTCVPVLYGRDDVKYSELINNNAVEHMKGSDKYITFAAGFIAANHDLICRYINERNSDIKGDVFDELKNKFDDMKDQFVKKSTVKDTKIIDMCKDLDLY